MRRDHHHLLTATIATQLILLALDLPGHWTDLASAAFAALLAILLRGITGRQRDFWLLLVLGVSAPLIDLAFSWHASPPAVNLVKVMLWSAGPAFLAWRLFVTIYQADPVRHHELAGAISIYLLLAYVFANVYEAMYLYDPTSLHFGDSFTSKDVGFGEILYFSFVTLATLGYGDVAPAHPATRAVAVVEAVSGLLYMAIMVARFVSLLTMHQGRGRD